MATLLAVLPHAKPVEAEPADPASVSTEVVERPDELAALTTARMTGKKVRITDKTTESAEFWALPTGVVQADVHAAPVRVRSSKGGWEPVNLNLVRQVDGSVAAHTHPAGLRLAGAVGAGGHDLVRLRYGAYEAAMSWSGALPEPVLEGTRATYKQVRPGVDLVVESTRTGFEQFLIVHDRAAVPHVRDVRLSLRSKGIRFEPDGRGGLMLKDRHSGARVGASPAPLMWDAQRLPASGEPARQAAVRTKSTARAGDRTDLVLTPDAGWLTSPNTRYPVTIDPAVQLTAGFDAFVQSDVTIDRSTQPILKIGTDDGGTVVSRSFVAFPGLDWLWGKQVQSATLRLWNELSTSCTPAEWQAWRVGSVTNAVRWTSQPTWIEQVGTSTETKGFAAACDDGWVGVPVTAALQHLATDGTYGTATLGLRATSETDSNGWKRFDSTEAVNDPHVVLTYHAGPTVTTMTTNPWARCATGSGRPYLSTATPRLRAQVSDPEAAPVQAKFEWWAVGGSAAIGSATSSVGASGSWRAVDVPAGALTNGTSYQWRAQGFDGSAWSAWSAWCEFTVDTTIPSSAPAVSSTDYPASSPTPVGAAHTAGTFTFGAAGVADVATYLYELDVNPPTRKITPSTLGGGVSLSITPKSDGPHTLYVRSRDRAGNLSSVRQYTFMVGPGGVVSPSEGGITAAKVNLAVHGHPASTEVRFQWRRAETDAWVTIPLANVTYTVGGGAVVSWPIATTGNGSYPALTWDVEATLAAADAQSIARDGPLQVRALFVGLSGTNPVRITFDRNRAIADTAAVGPGAVNLVTGNYAIGQTDASAHGLVVTRTFNTRNTGSIDAMFGPGWASAINAFDGAVEYTQLNVYGSLVQVGLPDDTTIGFTQKAATATTTTFEPQATRSRLSLTYSASGDSYALTDDDDNVVTFTRQPTDPAGQYVPTLAAQPGSGNTTTYTWEKVTVAGQVVVRPTRVLAPVPSGVNCGTTLVKGCRALVLTYSASTTATGTAEATWGDYTGRLKEVSFVGWDPDLSTPAMRTVVLARYAYDSTGRLRAAWDPRLDWLDGTVTRHLWHRYAYDGDGILTTITPPGEEPWQLIYSTLPTDSGKGRLHKVSRSALTAGTATDTLVYRVPTSGTGAPYDMSGGQTARWAQTAPPVDATAVFPATQIPTGTPATGVLPSSYERATVRYLDANARTVNVIEPGAYTSTTWYDEYGNVTRKLAAANHKRALENSGSDGTQEEAVIAETLSEVSYHSADGIRVVETYGPEHEITLATGEIVRGRKHVLHTYDEGLPAGQAPRHLVTTQATSVRYGDEIESDSRTTRTQYDWNLMQPTAEIVDPAGLNLRTRTAYDTAGRIVSITTPAGGNADNTPSTRVTVYYTTAANATFPECGGRAEWAGLVCRTHSGGQSASGPELMATTTTYDMYGQPRVHIEKNAAGTQRTTTTTYDAGGREYEYAIATPTGLGEQVAKRRNIYDTATEQLLRTQSIGSSNAVTSQVIRAYDTLGRMTSYTDADSNTSITTYDIASRFATTNDGKAVRTYAYDGGSERRGLLTQVVDSQAGTFNATYDAEKNPNSQVLPGGMSIATTADETGAPSTLRYDYPACGGADCTLYYEAVVASVHDQWMSRTSTLSTQSLGYDAAGRLTAVEDVVGDTCVTRAYSYSSASNRTGLTTYGPTAAGGCQSSAATSGRTWTYDTADRLTTAGTIYDALGRTTTVPTADLAGGSAAVAVGYYADDTVRSITQGTVSAIYQADVLNKRLRSQQVNQGTSQVTKVFHYSDDHDSPAWTDEGGWYTRIVAGTSSVAGIYSSGTAAVEWKIVSLHGDFVASVASPASGISAVHEADEHGLSRTGVALDQRYAYLGDFRRSAENPGHIITMGARLYNPATNRFLSVDPVYGGSANAYEYCSGDSVNCSDSTGYGDKDCKYKPWKPCGVVYNRSGNTLWVSDMPGGKGSQKSLRDGKNSKYLFVDVDSFCSYRERIRYLGKLYKKGEWIRIYGPVVVI
ncbi:RHS repeat-associated core domain-containing protein [Actinomycetes bacterium KLBMP 9797]